MWRATFARTYSCIRPMYFNPRPPCGGRPYWFPLMSELNIFQSTPSVGRATYSSASCSSVSPISIHALRGEGDTSNGTVSCADIISIHALRGEGDPLPQQICCRNGISIHALRGEGDQVKRIISNRKRAISIHALRGEGDIGTGRGSRHNRRNFNPRPPWGGRR